MKFALIGPTHPLRGGIAHYNARLFHALRQAGHSVRLFGMSRQYPDTFFPGTRQEDLSEEAFKAPATLVLDSTDPRTWWGTFEAVRSARAEVVVFQWWHPFFAPCYATIAAMLQQWTDARVIYLCHNVRPHEATLLDDLLLKIAYMPVGRFMVHAKQEALVLDRVLGRPPKVAVAAHPVYDIFKRPEGLDRQSARQRLGLTRPHQLLFFGYVRAYKGLQVLLEAMPSILERVDCELTVAGECYEDAEVYKRQIEALGLSGRVHFLDEYIPNEDVPVYFEAADVCVLPYRHATQSGIVQVSYALETPVVVSRVGGIPEVVDEGRTGLLVPPEDHAALAQAVVRYFEESMEAELVEGIQEKLHELSWGKVVAALESLAKESQI